MQFKPQYYIYKDLVETGRQTIHTKDLNKGNIERHFYACIDILKDGIETDFVQGMMIHVIFVDNEDINLSIFDYIINLMMWQLCTSVSEPIKSTHLAFFENITKKEIKNYIDNIYVDKYRKSIPFMELNNTIDDVIGKFRDLRQFQMYLANTLNLKDTIDLMRKYPEFNDTIHFDSSNIPLEDIKDRGLDAANIQIRYIKNSDHCLRDSFRTGEAISPKQYKEVGVNIGTKPDGQGSVFPRSINHSFMNGGLSDPIEICIESSVGRVAQILQKTNVGESGAFARLLELNNQDTIFYPDPNYTCDTKNFEEVVIEDATMLKMFDLRYYRTNPKGIDTLLNAKTDKHLIGQKLYFRSPMTCASHARGQGLCYKCYGDLAYTNQEINIGEIASEGLSSIYTQILLSAKHLLESLIIKLEWNVEFYEYFSLAFNTFALKSTGYVYKGKKLIIDEDIKCIDEMDDSTYNYYINSFIVKEPNGKEFRIHTSNSDNIYFVPEFYDYYLKCKSKTKSYDDSDKDIVEMDMVELLNFPCMFIMEMRNNELSRTMDQIERLIDNNTVISSYDRNSILKEFIKQNVLGGIKLNSVHFEILLMNQIRAADDDLELPDWTIPNVPYQIISLTKSLTNNRSITVRLQSNKVDRAMNSPQNRYINKPAFVDLFYMEKPQEYLSDGMVSDEYKPKSDKDDNLVCPIKIIDPEKEKK
jgi:hypothetical protein